MNEQLIAQTMEKFSVSREAAIKILTEPGLFARTWETLKLAASAEADALCEGVVSGTAGVGTALGLGLGAVGAIWVGQKAGVIPSFSASASGKVAG